MERARHKWSECTNGPRFDFKHFVLDSTCILAEDIRCLPLTMLVPMMLLAKFLFRLPNDAFSQFPISQPLITDYFIDF